MTSGSWGRWRSRHGGRAVVLNSQRQRRLLAVLLLGANADVSLERLIDALWDDPPQTARQQIHNIVGQLRRLLPTDDGQGRILTVHDGYRLNVSPDRIDLSRFHQALRKADAQQAQGDLDGEVRALGDALDVWRGAALGGLGGRYLVSVAAWLDEQRLIVTERQVAARIRRGESGTLIGELTGLVAEHPLREPLRASLMTALHRAGRQAEALA